MSTCDICIERETKIVFRSSEMGTEHFCFSCYNKMIEDELGVKFEPKMESFSLKDGAGNERHFFIEGERDAVLFW